MHDAMDMIANHLGPDHQKQDEALSSARRIVRDEIQRASSPLVERWRRLGLRGYLATLISALTVVVLWAGRATSSTMRFVDRISAVRLTQPLPVVLAKTPLSLFAPTFRLPVTGAVLQVLIVVAIGEAHLGARRTALVAIGTQMFVNIIGVQMVRSGHSALLGIAPHHLSDRDTGPSVAVITIAITAAVFARTYLLATITTACLLLATGLLPDRAGHEHLAGIALGAILGYELAVRDRRSRLLHEHQRLMSQRRHTRRIASAIVAASGLIALVSSTTRPMAQRLRTVVDLVSLATAKTANGVVAASGLALLVLALGLRRGSRRGWQLSLAVLAVTATGHLLKGGDVEEAAFSAVALAYLLARHDAFRAAGDPDRSRHAVRSLVLGLLGVFAGGVIAVEAATAEDHHRLRAYDAAKVVASRMRGHDATDITPRLDEFLRPALFGLGVAIVIVALWRALRPALARRVEGAARLAEDQRARSIVATWGNGTLDYFALRSDKHHFFHDDSMVSYAVDHSICLVSPDPIGPPEQRTATWAEFRRFADAQGWTITVLAASAQWLPLYLADGMTALYVGDEAVVDVQRFDLAGGERKSLRQAVNRVARAGYTVTFHDPAELSPSLRDELTELMAASRRGGVERGFSMTLGRIFDPADEHLLLAVCTGPDGHAAAFCQYVPSGPDGWSLDLMRRDLGDHPNGLLDFVLVETITMLRTSGAKTLGLNFATMRAVLAGERGTSKWQQLQRWVLLRLSVDLQIASLWKFNAKYGPTWQPRHVALDGTEYSVASAIAVARAEGMWELPVIGRWFRPAAPQPAPTGRTPGAL